MLRVSLVMGLILVALVVSRKINLGTQVEYRFYKDVGQVGKDRRTDLHAVSGYTIAEESSDVVWTERGAYFGGSSLISLPSNAVSKTALTLPNDFLIGMWVYPIEGGNIFTVYDPENPVIDIKLVYVQPITLEAHKQGAKATIGIPFGNL